MNRLQRLRDIDWSLYAIIDREWLKGRAIEDVAEGMIDGGADVIQYRDKVSEGGDFYRSALKLRRVLEEGEVPLIVNDRVDVAMAVYAEGVHLGQEDMPVDIVREIVGPDVIIGGSVHSLEEFERVKRADYFGVGAIFQTKTKEQPFVSGVGIIQKIRKSTDRPIIGIGGITVDNLSAVIQAGAHGVAVISGIMGSRDIRKATRAYHTAIQRARKRR